jgi:hypothetical protein
MATCPDLEFNTTSQFQETFPPGDTYVKDKILNIPWLLSIIPATQEARSEGSWFLGS